MAVQNRSGVSHSDSRTIAAMRVRIAKMYYTVFKICAIGDRARSGIADVPTPPNGLLFNNVSLFTVTEVNYKCTFVFLCSRYVNERTGFARRHGEQAAVASAVVGGTLFPGTSLA